MIAKLRGLIARHHGEPLTLRDAARSVNVSRFYFCKVIKIATGLTFTGYLARVRVEAVKALMLDANLRISEAAFAAGFQSLSQFNRSFHRVSGESPRSYRERLHGKSSPAAQSLVFAPEHSLEPPSRVLRAIGSRLLTPVSRCG
jgi:AraC-like DNA-binding protein